MTLVCQRWRRVFYSRVCNRLWRSLTLTGSHASSNQDNWLAAKRSLLQRVAAWAEAVTMRPEARMSLVMRWVGARPAAQLLRLLHPATLRSLSLNYDCTTDVAQALRRLTGLTALRLPAGDGCKAVSEHLATALSSLPQLQSLSLTISVWDLSSNGAMLTACFPSQVTALELRCGPLRLEGFPHSRLPVLAHLCLSVSTLPPALVSDIAQLRALSHLELSSLDATLLTPAVLGPPACLPQLVSLQLKSGRPFLNGGLNLDAAADAADLLQQQLAAFPRLTQLSYDADGGLPLVRLTACLGCTAAWLYDTCVEWGSAFASPPSPLTKPPQYSPFSPVQPHARAGHWWCVCPEQNSFPPGEGKTHPHTQVNQP